MYANTVATSKVKRAIPCWLSILNGSSSFFLSSGWQKFTNINPVIIEMFVWSFSWLGRPELIKIFNLLCGLNNWAECVALNIVSHPSRNTFIDECWSFQFEAFIFFFSGLTQIFWFKNRQERLTKQATLFFWNSSNGADLLLLKS